MIELTFNDYDTSVSQFRLPTADTPYVVLGLIGELGELYGSWAKSIRDGTELDHKEVMKELGDILWFLNALCRDLDTDLEQVALMNIDKLTKRSVAGTLQGSGDNR